MSINQMELLQEYNYERNLLKAYSCFIVGARFNTPIPKEVLLSATEKLVSQRRLLRANVINRQVTELDFQSDDIVEIWDEDIELLDALNKAHENVFDVEVAKPLWKLIYITKLNWILIVCDHTLYDGTTATYILQDLGELFNGNEIAEDVDLSEEFRTLNEPSYYYWFSTVLSAYNPINWIYSKFAAESPFELDRTIKDISTYRTLKYLIKLTSNDLNSIKVKLKKHKVSLTSLLCYLNGKVLSKYSNKSKIEVPVNLRKFLDLQKRPYGSYVTAVSVQLESAKSNNEDEDGIDWDRLRSIDSQLSTSCQKEAAQLIGMLQYLNFKNHFKQRIAQPRELLLEISNLGFGDISSSAISNNNSSTDHYQAEEYIFSQPNSHVGEFFNKSMISKKNGDLNMLLSGAPESKEVFYDYAKELDDLIRRLV